MTGVGAGVGRSTTSVAAAAASIHPPHCAAVRHCDVVRASEIGVMVGGRAGSYEKELRKARRMALDDLTEEAAELGANAVVGIDLDYEVLGEKNGMLMVSASGTAVVVE